MFEVSRRLLELPRLLRHPRDGAAWRNFLDWTLAELREHSGQDAELFLQLSEAQCVARDLLHVARELGCEKESGKTQLPPTSLREVQRARERVRKLRCVTGLPFLWGMCEPVESEKKPVKITAELVRRLRFLHDVVRIEHLVVLEKRFFAPEREVWSSLCRAQHGAQLIAIDDWTLPSEEALVSFGLATQRAAERGEQLACHCIAGDGRTGLCFLFLFVCIWGLADLVALLLQLAARYKQKAAAEILTMLVRGQFDCLQLFDRLAHAAQALQARLELLAQLKQQEAEHEADACVGAKAAPATPLFRFPVPRLRRAHAHVTDSELAQLARFKIVPRPPKNKKPGHVSTHCARCQPPHVTRWSGLQ